MKNFKIEGSFIFVAILFTFISCDCTYQYDVLVKNETGETIEVKYKTSIDVRGEIEESVLVSNGELQRIISTESFDGGLGCSGIDKRHCEFIADYISAYLGKAESSIKWCTDDVLLNQVDIEQGEFIITYKAADF